MIKMQLMIIAKTKPILDDDSRYNFESTEDLLRIIYIQLSSLTLCQPKILTESTP